MQARMDHIVLNIEDDEKMITFYTKVLLFEAERLEEYLAGVVPFPSVRLNPETIIDLFPEKLWRQNITDQRGRDHLNHFCFSMNKVTWDNLVERLKSEQITIEEGPVPRWGAHGTGTSIYFRDPESNLIEARFYEDQNSSEKCLLGS